MTFWPHWFHDLFDRAGIATCVATVQMVPFEIPNHVANFAQYIG